MNLLAMWRARRAWRQAERESVAAEAARLIERDGPLAYMTAREFGRTFRQAGKRDGSIYWSNVAVEIARLTGRTIGEKAADRWSR